MIDLGEILWDQNHAAALAGKAVRPPGKALTVVSRVLEEGGQLRRVHLR